MTDFLDVPIGKRKIGIVGCGEMGLPMATRLKKASFDVRGHDIKPIHSFGNFRANMISSKHEFGSTTDVLFSVVRNWQETEKVCFGTNGIFATSPPPVIFIVCSTRSPKYIHILREKLPADTVLVDAPMSGATYRAKDGTLTFMVGGDKAVVNYLRPLFEEMGKDINHLGELGRGMTCKVLNNMLAATSVVAVRQVLEAADYLDFPRDQLLDIAKTSSGSTWFGDNIANIDWADESYDATNTIGILEKDVQSLVETTEGKPDLNVNKFAKNIISALHKL